MQIKLNIAIGMFDKIQTSRNVTSTLDHVLTASLPRSKNSRTWRGRGQIETISDF